MVSFLFEPLSYSVLEIQCMIWIVVEKKKECYVLQTACLTLSNLSRAISWPNAYLVGHLLEHSGDCASDVLACMVMEEPPKIPEKAAVIHSRMYRTISFLDTGVVHMWCNLRIRGAHFSAAPGRNLLVCHNSSFLAEWDWMRDWRIIANTAPSNLV